MKHNILPYISKVDIFLFSVLFWVLILPQTTSCCRPAPVYNRIIATISSTTPALSIQSSQGISEVRIAELIPQKGLDFRKTETLKLKITTDGQVHTDEFLASLIPLTQRRRVKTLELNQRFSGFDKLEIMIYDTSGEIDYTVDVVLYVR